MAEPRLGLNEYQIADRVLFRSGAGWAQGTVTKVGRNYLIIQYHRNSNTTFATIHDHRNIKLHSKLHTKTGKLEHVMPTDTFGEIQQEFW